MCSTGDCVGWHRPGTVAAILEVVAFAAQAAQRLNEIAVVTIACGVVVDAVRATGLSTSTLERRAREPDAAPAGRRLPGD